MIIAVLFLMSIIFVELFVAFDLQGRITSALALSRDALKILTSSTVKDEEKEVLIRRIALQMFKMVAVFTTQFLLIVIVLYVVYILVIRVTPFSKEAFLEAMASASTLGLLTVATLLYIWIRNVIRQRL